MLTYEEAATISETYGDSFYVFDRQRFISNFNGFKSAFRSYYQDTQIAYSYKTNYTPAICRIVDSLGGYAEVVSEMEFDLAMALGIECRKVIYNGPCKSMRSLQQALAGGAVINLDSRRDLENVREILSGSPDLQARLAIRCNFDIGTGHGSRFGTAVDGSEFVEIASGLGRTANAHLIGLHCHFQDRDLASFERRTRKLLEIADSLFDSPPELINVGGGYFGSLPESLRERYDYPIPKYEDYARVIGGLLSEHYSTASDRPILFTEPGTAMVADTMRFVTRVIDRKEIGSKNYVYVAGSIFNVSPYARLSTLPVSVVRKSGQVEDGRDGEPFDVCGYTCIERDILSKDLRLPVDVGDYLVYENVGSYSIVMKPPFILPNVPVLMHDEATASYKAIKRAENVDDIFSTFDLSP